MNRYLRASFLLVVVFSSIVGSVKILLNKCLLVGTVNWLLLFTVKVFLFIVELLLYHCLKSVGGIVKMSVCC